MTRKIPINLSTSIVSMAIYDRISLDIALQVLISLETSSLRLIAVDLSVDMSCKGAFASERSSFCDMVNH